MSEEQMREEHADWCRSLYSSLGERGVWGVPRSGLFFEKRGDKLILVLAQDYSDERPLGARAWQEYQQADYEAISEQFGQVGVIVEKREGIWE